MDRLQRLELVFRHSIRLKIDMAERKGSGYPPPLDAPLCRKKSLTPRSVSATDIKSVGPEFEPRALTNDFKYLVKYSEWTFHRRQQIGSTAPLKLGEPKGSTLTLRLDDGNTGISPLKKSMAV